MIVLVSIKDVGKADALFLNSRDHIFVLLTLCAGPGGVPGDLQCLPPRVSESVKTITVLKRGDHGITGRGM